VGSAYFVKSLARGLTILETIANSERSLSLTEIASAVELDKSTTFGFLSTLEDLGYLERNPKSKLYRPGLKVLNLGFAYLNSRGIIQIAKPYLKALSDEAGARTDISLRDGKEIVTVAIERAPRIMDIGTRVGSRLPVHCTSSGKAQLIDLCHDELVNLLGEGPYPVWGPNTLTTPDASFADLDQARQRGYAIGDDEVAAGLRAASAPIRDREGRIVAAICASMPSALISRHEMEAVVAPKVVFTAGQISAALSTDVSLL